MRSQLNAVKGRECEKAISTLVGLWWKPDGINHPLNNWQKNDSI